MESLKKNRRGKREQRRLPASLTVEAAYVMGIVLFAMAVLLRYGFQLHDQVTGNAVLNEGIELLGHSEEPDIGALSQRGSRRMEYALSGRQFQIRLQEEGEGYSGTTGGLRYQKEIKDKGFHPERFLRQVTLLEGLGEAYGD